MDCLKDYIGISGCGATLPVLGEGQTLEDVFSGLYINQLPGISLKSIEKLADSEQENYLGVWFDVKRRALLKFGLAFRGNVNKSHSITDRSVIDCLVCENKESFSVALWYLLGTEMMIERTSTDRLNRYTTIDFEKAERLKEYFYTEYQAAFSDAIRSMKVTGSDCIDDCVPCNGSNIEFVEAYL